ncbi:MAG: sigma-70 family RNA polymerase sigma factor [Spirochaetaceae bacterium]|jgi:RNA polymerase sigma-70 factor (ECF subfamily)|nr:sigma-70 family RNA polymerase sigma factor [Spirochaetaceae bacterium]
MFRGTDAALPDFELDDKIIVERVLGGECELYRLLVERHQRQVNALGMSFLRNKDDAADFSQDVFFKAFHSLEQFEGAARFSTWLYRIAYNTALNKVSRRKEYMSLAENYEGESSTLTPEEESVKEAVRQAVRQAVSELPEKYRLCIDLFFFYDRSYEEIEAITGDPVGTIKSHVFRAKKILREKLQDLQGGC